MKYMLLIYTDGEAYSKVSEEENQKIFGEYGAFTQGIVESGEFVSGDPLQGNDTTTTVRTSNDQTLVTDGPFIESTEFLAGYYVIDVPNLDRAIEIAGKLPGVPRGLDTIEIRPVMAVPADMGGS